MAFLRFLFAAVLCLMQLWLSNGSAVKEFNDWEGLKEDMFNTEYSMVDFFASWCPHCVTLAPKFEKAAEMISQGSLKNKIHLVKIQCDDGKTGETKPICQKNNIQGFPTTRVYQKGKMFDEYKGGRTPEAFVQYAEQIEKSGKPLFAGQHRNDQHVCLAKDFKKYLNRKIVH